MPIAPDRGNFPWEFGYIVDEDRRETGFAVVRGRPMGPDRLAVLADLARDHQMVGITCRGVFPMIGDGPGDIPDERESTEGRDEPYIRTIEGWAHCFRDPDCYLPPDKPWILFSNSDNLEPDRIWRVATMPGPIAKRWDFVYCCLSDQANVLRKNWELAKSCAIRLADELGLRGVIVGRLGAPDAPDHPRIDVLPQLPWPEFLRCIAESRVAFVPNTWDPSPRMMAEAMCLDVPVLVNREILGGWKYVCEATGRFFTDEHDVLGAMAEIRSSSFEPATWYRANYGRANAGPRLAAFLNGLADGTRATATLETAWFYTPREWKGAMPGARRQGRASRTDL